VLAKVPLPNGGYREGYITTPHSRNLDVLVRREKGSSGDVSVRYTTMAGSAMPGVHYGTRDGNQAELSGTLYFASSVSELRIAIPILPELAAGGTTDTVFRVVLSQATGGAVIGTADTTDRGASGDTMVTIKYDDDAHKLAEEVAQLLEEHYDEFRVKRLTYCEQIASRCFLPAMGTD
jgi:hypothetical protein